MSETKTAPTLEEQEASWNNGLVKLQAEAIQLVGDKSAIEYEAQALVDSIEPKLAVLRSRMLPVDTRLQWLNMRIQDCHAKLAYLRGLRGGSPTAPMPQGAEMTEAMTASAQEQVDLGMVLGPIHNVIIDETGEHEVDDEEFARQVAAGNATPPTTPE